MSLPIKPSGRPVFTIGHSNHSLEKLVGLLKNHGIEVLVDVRSQPYSKYATHFNTRELEPALMDVEIRYLFLGKELGGLPEGAEYYDAQGHVLYSRLAESPLFLQGISRVEKGVRRYRVALMCGEEDPTECHRRLLVARVLMERGIVVHHIRGDGSLQSEETLAKEEADRGRDYVQQDLFQAPEDTAWKSTRSVTRKERQPSSSERYGVPESSD